MKKLLLVGVLTVLSFYGYSQTSFTINNESGETLMVGVQVTNQVSGACDVVSSYGSSIDDGFSDSYTMTGSEYPMRVGASGISGSGFVFYNPTCGADAPGPYLFVWGSWNEVTIF